VHLTPFRALRYDPAVAGPPGRTSAPPYDALDALRHTRHRTTNPYTVLELLAGGGAEGYGRAADALARWRRTGVLALDPEPALHLYEQHELRHGVPVVHRGIIGAVPLADLDGGELLLHEHVDPRRTAARAERLRAVPVEVTPVVVLHTGAACDVAGEVARARSGPPLAAFTDEEQVDHRLWRIADGGVHVAVADALAGALGVLADGHHRVAAVREVAPSGSVTAWVVDAEVDGLELRAVHRVVEGLPPADPSGAPAVPGFRALRWPGPAAALADAVAAMPAMALGVVTAAGAWVLRPEDERRMRAAASRLAVLGALDAQVVQAAVLPAIGGAGAAVHAVADVDDVLVRVAAGSATALLLRPPTAAQVVEVARAGARMPAKTTWFRPKPRSGLVMRLLDEAQAGERGPDRDARPLR
jgi:uncharacterized protein (DUF1015 family)